MSFQGSENSTINTSFKDGSLSRKDGDSSGDEEAYKSAEESWADADSSNATAPEHEQFEQPAEVPATEQNRTEAPPRSKVLTKGAIFRGAILAHAKELQKEAKNEAAGNVDVNPAGKVNEPESAKGSN
jgi:hypothetical protein